MAFGGCFGDSCGFLSVFLVEIVWWKVVCFRRSLGKKVESGSFHVDLTDLFADSLRHCQRFKLFPTCQQEHFS